MSATAADLEQLLAASWPVIEWREVHIVIAVSGGADSVALLRACAALHGRAGGRGKLVVAHLDHGLRPESAADAKWITVLCERIGCDCEIGRCDVASRAAAAGDGFEAAARAARYDFLLQTAERHGARYVATAHTADDQVETILHRILRGTGVAGLAGMRSARPLSAAVTLIRPLLAASRADVLAYLNNLGQDYRLDATNLDTRFTRNRIRNALLPELRANFNSDIDAALLRLGQQAAEVQAVVAAEAKLLADVAVTISPSAIRLDCRPLRPVSPHVVREVCKSAWSDAGWPLQAMRFDDWLRLANFVRSAESPPFTLPANVQVARDGDHVELLRTSLSL